MMPTQLRFCGDVLFRHDGGPPVELYDLLEQVAQKLYSEWVKTDEAEDCGGYIGVHVTVEFYEVQP